VLIGERINPTGKKILTTALKSGNIEPVRMEALAQVEAGADILDLNCGIVDVDEVSLLPRIVQVVMNTVDVPLCIDSSNPKALKAALNVYKGKPLINSVTGEDYSLKTVLPLVKEFGAAVIGLTNDAEGVPSDAEGRLGIARKILRSAEQLGLPREDVIIDCLAMPVGADCEHGHLTVETICKVKSELGVNLTLGASNVSFGLPDRDLLNKTFLAMVIAAGVTCPMVNVAKVRSTVLASDVILGYDRHATRYTNAYRQRRKEEKSQVSASLDFHGTGND
jgi:5-methyltetrahydrofolate--homocysteine methyltransferase